MLIAVRPNGGADQSPGLPVGEVMKTVQKRWLDLGELGQHQAEIEAQICTDFPSVDSVEVTIKGETVQLVHLVSRTLEAELIAEFEIDYRAYQSDMADDRRLDELLAREAA